MKRTPKSFTVEIRSGGRKNSAAPNTPIRKAQTSSPTKAAFVPDEEAPKPWRTARILPALEPSEPSAFQTLAAPADTLPPEQEDADIDSAEDVIAGEPDERTSDPTLMAVELLHEINSVTLIRHNLAQNEDLPRQAFRRSERWKHRLPKVIQQHAGKRAQ